MRPKKRTREECSELEKAFVWVKFEVDDSWGPACLRTRTLSCSNFKGCFKGRGRGDSGHLTPEEWGEGCRKPMPRQDAFSAAEKSSSCLDVIVGSSSGLSGDEGERYRLLVLIGALQNFGRTKNFETKCRTILQSPPGRRGRAFDVLNAALAGARESCASYGAVDLFV